MENYFNMNLTKQEIDAISNLGLAHMGDCVFEILCRGFPCAKGGKNVGNLHRDTINMVKAQSQAKFVDKLLKETDILIPSEEFALGHTGTDDVSEAAKKWNISERSVRNYCAEGRVDGAFLVGKTWNIPEDAKKPERANKSSLISFLFIFIKWHKAKTTKI